MTSKNEIDNNGSVVKPGSRAKNVVIGVSLTAVLLLGLSLGVASYLLNKEDHKHIPMEKFVLKDEVIRIANDHKYDNEFITQVIYDEWKDKPGYSEWIQDSLDSLTRIKFGYYSDPVWDVSKKPADHIMLIDKPKKNILIKPDNGIFHIKDSIIEFQGMHFNEETRMFVENSILICDESFVDREADVLPIFTKFKNNLVIFNSYDSLFNDIRPYQSDFEKFVYAVVPGGGDPKVKSGEIKGPYNVNNLFVENFVYQLANRYFDRGYNPAVPGTMIEDSYIDQIYHES